MISKNSNWLPIFASVCIILLVAASLTMLMLGKLRPPTSDLAEQPPANNDTNTIPTLLGITQFGSDQDDVAQGVTVDGSGIYIVGATEGSWDKANAGDTSLATPRQASALGATHTFGLADATDAYIHKYSLDGKNKLWGQQFGTSFYDAARGVASNSSGIYVAGITEGSLDGPIQGNADSFLRKYSPAGELLWVRQFGTNKTDEGLWVVADEARVCLGGGTLGLLAGDRKFGDEDIFVRCYNNAGAELWTVQFGSDKFEETQGATIDATGIYVAGTTGGQIGTDKRRGQEDMWYGQLSLTDGHLITTRQFGSKATDFGHGIATDDQNVYISGRTEGNLANDKTAGSSDAGIFAYSKTSTLVPSWSDQYGTSGGDASADVLAYQGNVYMLGVSNGKTEKHALNEATEDGFIRQYSAAGQLQWSGALKTDDYDEPRSSFIYNDILYVVGYTGGVIGDENFGAWDEFIARFNLSSE
jgi:hypothetical protein